MNEVYATLKNLPGPVPPIEPPTQLVTEICGTLDAFSIYHWDEHNDKFMCFDYGALVSVREITNNIGVDADIVPT